MFLLREISIGIKSETAGVGGKVIPARLRPFFYELRHENVERRKDCISYELKRSEGAEKANE